MYCSRRLNSELACSREDSYSHLKNSERPRHLVSCFPCSLIGILSCYPKFRQVSPSEIETVLLGHPDVIDAAVIGIKDDAVGDLPRAFVVVKRPEVSTDDIAKYVNGQFSS
jgi:AMP-binding enzyme C-terminal domain